ncbi:MAG: AAA family ATPase, partial [Victivallales bacterium]|nr:AAA family ATPase [Victivallales bacterium]
MKKLTSSVYTFEKLITSDCLYVDKTEYIWQLLEQPYGTFFLARPRRFGKSLTLSTLKAVFQGKKDLFKGLALESKPYDWKEYPVIHLDFGEIPAKSVHGLESALCQAIDQIADTYKISLSSDTAAGKLSELIRLLQPLGKVVILIDEYDKPILDNILVPHIEELRREMEDFYSVIKATEPYQRFVMLTGVSKFSKVSVFSKLNNLTDISMRADYATMLGYTQNELETNFSAYIDRTVKQLGI